MNIGKEREETTTQGTQFKLKSNLMNKFFNEPVDALDLRLAKAEENLSTLPIDPFTDIKQEEEEKLPFCVDDHPLDCSEVQIATPAPTYLDERIEFPQQDFTGDEELPNEQDIPPLIRTDLVDTSETSCKDIQRVTLRASSGLNSLSPSAYQHDHSGWRISPIPWRSLLTPDQQDLYPEERARDQRFHGQKCDYRIPQYYESNNGLSSRYEDPKSYRGQISPTYMSKRLFYEGRSSISDLPNLGPDRINVIDYGRESIQHKRLHDQLQPSDTDFPHSKRFKQYADTDEIDRRISLAENITAENPLFSTREAKQNENCSYPTNFGDKSSPWWKNHSLSKSNVPPSEKYMNRCQELICDTSQHMPLHKKSESAGHIERLNNLVHHPTHESMSEIKPQRLSSVIVRNTSGKLGNPIQSHSYEHPQTSTNLSTNLCTGEYLKDEKAKFARKHLTQNEPNSSPLDNGFMNQNWLEKLQNLRAGFAYKMMEAQSQQGLESHPFSQPNFQTKKQFPNDLSKSFDNKIPHLEALPKNQNKGSGVLNETPYHLPQNSRSDHLHYRSKPEQIYKCSSTITSKDICNKGPERSPNQDDDLPDQSVDTTLSPLCQSGKGKRGRPRKHAPKLPLPPLYVFIRNLLHNPAYNPSVVAWVDDDGGCFKVTNTTEFAKTWGRMKSNRSEEMNYEKMSRAMRYHYGCERQGRKGHLAMVKEKRLYYRFGELSRNWRSSEVADIVNIPCTVHTLCHSSLCLWTKE